MSQYTQGEWELIFRFGAPAGISAGKARQYVNGEAKDQIAMIIPAAEDNGGVEATLGNARLMASSPKLLKTLMALCEKLPSKAKNVISYEVYHAKDELEAARAAIAEAMGGV